LWQRRRQERRSRSSRRLRQGRRRGWGRHWTRRWRGRHGRGSGRLGDRNSGWSDSRGHWCGRSSAGTVEDLSGHERHRKTVECTQVEARLAGSAAKPIYKVVWHKGGIRSANSPRKRKGKAVRPAHRERDVFPEGRELGRRQRQAGSSNGVRLDHRAEGTVSKRSRAR